MEACGSASPALRVPGNVTGVQLLSASGKAFSGHACPAAPSASTGSCGHELHASPESDSALGPESAAAADAPGTPPGVAPALALCRSPREPRAPNAAALFGLGAGGNGVAPARRLPTLVPVQGSAAPRVLLGCRGGALGRAWPVLPLGACTAASASVQAGAPSPVPASLPAAAALAAGVAAPTASLLRCGAPARPLLPSSLAAAVAIASGAPLAAQRDRAQPLGAGLGFGTPPAPPLAPPALPLGAMPDVWQLLGTSLAHYGVAGAPQGGPEEDGYYLCRLGAADLACACAGGAAASASPAAQQGTTVAYVCQAIKLPPTGSSAPPLLPVKVLSAPAPAALGSLFATSATASAPAAALLPAAQLPDTPALAGLLPPGLGLDAPAGFAALPAPASAGPAQDWSLTPSTSSAFCSVGSRPGPATKSRPMPYAPSAGSPVRAEPCAGPRAAGSCAGAADMPAPSRPGAPPWEAGVSLGGRARRRHIAAREAAARELGKGPVQGLRTEPCRVAAGPGARRGAERGVVHRPAKLRRLVPEATQLLLLSAAAGALLQPMGAAEGIA